MAAPTATGWNHSCRARFAPPEDAHLCTAHIILRYGPSTPSDSGVSSVPAYWLLDPSGKIVAKAYDPDELSKSLGKRLK
jgi:hypothetical protein